jgi:hypothetical protein
MIVTRSSNWGSQVIIISEPSAKQHDESALNRPDLGFAGFEPV